MTQQDHRQPPDCVFCRIASGDLPAQIVYKDADLVAFLDIGPIRPGHVQIVPRAHFPYFDDLPATLAGRMIALGQRLAKAQKRIFAVERVGFLFTGGDVAHAHAHVVPLHEMTDITSRRYIQEPELTFAAMPRLSDVEMQTIAADLSAALFED
jgi:histidine triad (HIT) family protein